MATAMYRYSFDPDIPMDEVEQTLVLALVIVQILHGDAQTRLTVSHFFDRRRRTCVIDATTPQGADLSKLLVGLLAREYGPDSFSVRPAQRRSRRLAPTTALEKASVS